MSIICALPPVVLSRVCLLDNPATNRRRATVSARSSRQIQSMQKSYLAAFLALGVVVGGCSIGQQNADQTAALDAQDAQACRISGASPGSQSYAECRRRLGEQRASTKVQNTQESRQREIDARMQAGLPPTSSR